MMTNYGKSMIVCAFVAIVGVCAAASAGENMVDNVKGNVDKQAWTEAFASQTEEKFEEAMVEDVLLEGSAMVSPVQGREKVKMIMAAASNYYVYCNFIDQAVNGNRTYLEWDLLTVSGMSMQGVTVLTKNDAGQLVKIALHHRPLGKTLIFSSELGDRLAGKIARDHFYK